MQYAKIKDETPKAPRPSRLIFIATPQDPIHEHCKQD